MTELNIQTKVETAQAEKNVDDLTGSVDKLDSSLKDTEKSAGLAEKATKGMSTATKALGGALKGLGIGLIVAALGALHQMITNNQKVMDAINITLETIGNLFNQVTDAVGNAFEKVSKATGGFESLQKVGSSLLTIVLTPIQLAFYGIVGAVQNAQLAWEQSWLGDGDPKEIKRLNEAIAETEQDLQDVAKGAIQAGKDIGENIGGAISEIGKLGSAVIEETSKVSVSTAIAAAEANVQLQNTARLAAAEQQILIERYDRQAEQLRQLRDDDRRTIKERIESNKQLGVVLEEQSESMLRLADLQVAAAASELERQNNIENQVALLEAQANREGILAQIEGFRSEQKMNYNSLLREQEAQMAEERKIEAEEQAEWDALFAEAEESQRKNKEAADKKAAEEELKLKEQTEKAKADIIAGTFALAQELAGENVEVQKGIAAAQAIYNGYLAVQVALASAPPPLNFVLAGIVGGMAAANVAKILSTSSSTAGGGGMAGAGSAPAVPTQQQPRVPEFGFANQGVGGSQNAMFGSTRAYVVNQEIQDQQALNSKLNDLQKMG